VTKKKGESIARAIFDFYNAKPAVNQTRQEMLY